MSYTFDVTSLAQLIAAIDDINAGVDAEGNPLVGPVTIGQAGPWPDVEPIDLTSEVPAIALPPGVTSLTFTGVANPYGNFTAFIHPATANGVLVLASGTFHDDGALSTFGPVIVDPGASLSDDPVLEQQFGETIAGSTNFPAVLPGTAGQYPVTSYVNTLSLTPSGILDVYDLPDGAAFAYNTYGITHFIKAIDAGSITGQVTLDLADPSFLGPYTPGIFLLPPNEGGATLNLPAQTKLSIEGDGIVLRGPAYNDRDANTHVPLGSVATDGTSSITDVQFQTVNGGLRALSGTLSISDVSLVDLVARGNNGTFTQSGTGFGGGGGGFGGGLFVAAGASVTLQNVRFFDDGAVGGTGGYDPFTRSLYSFTPGHGHTAYGTGFTSTFGGTGPGGRLDGFREPLLGLTTGDGLTSGGLPRPNTFGQGGFVSPGLYSSTYYFVGGFGGGGAASAYYLQRGFGGGFGGGGGYAAPGSFSYTAALHQAFGGGGLAAGGDIFVQQGGSLLMVGGELGAPAILQGGKAGGPGAGAGEALGGALFLQGDASATLAAPAGTTLGVFGSIADEAANGGPSTAAGSLVVGIAGDTGEVALNVADAFAGGITLVAGTLELGAAGAAGSGPITFADNGVDPTLSFTGADAPTNPIAGFDSNSVIDITDLQETSVSGPAFTPNGAGGGTLTLTGTQLGTSNPESVSLTFSGYTGPFVLSADSGGGTDLTEQEPPCYCRDTLILTERGEVPVQDLAIGDRLITRTGAARPIVWIGRRTYADRFALSNPTVWPVLIRAGALADGIPKRDLQVSPLHAMYLDDILIPASALVNGVSIVTVERPRLVEYLHLELASHDVIIAEGALSESFVDDDSRMMFHNAADYAALYPDAVRRPPLYCAPRLTGGFAVEAVRQKLGERAGTRPARPAEKLIGFIDLVRSGMITGWAQNPDKPEVPVCLDILVGGVLVAQTLANRYRADLEAAGLGSGRHSFTVRLAVTQQERVEVRRSADQVALPFGAKASKVA